MNIAQGYGVVVRDTISIYTHPPTKEGKARIMVGIELDYPHGPQKNHTYLKHHDHFFCIMWVIYFSDYSILALPTFVGWLVGIEK